MKECHHHLLLLHSLKKRNQLLPVCVISATEWGQEGGEKTNRSPTTTSINIAVAGERMSRQRLCDGRGKKENAERERKRNKNAYKKFQIEEKKKRKKCGGWSAFAKDTTERTTLELVHSCMSPHSVCVYVCVFRRCQFSFPNFFSRKR